MNGRDSLTCLLIPGIDGSGPEHWQTRWAIKRADCEVLDLGDWALPERDRWVGRLDRAIERRDGRPIVLVAHSLGCLLVSWWAERYPEKGRRIAGALLVAPCDVNRGHDARLARYAPMPAAALPFPTLMIGSTNDPYASTDRLEEYAKTLDADFVELGALGHINAASQLGGWAQGERMLELLRAQTVPHWRARHSRGSKRHPSVTPAVVVDLEAKRHD